MLVVCKGTNDTIGEGMKRAFIIGLILIVAGAAIWFFTRHSESTIAYEFETLARGDIENTVSCTGTLEATSTVEVGTQLSGTVSEVLVDYNDVVRVGQALAIIDTTQLVLTVQADEAALKKAEASLLVARLDYDSNKDLFSRDYASQYDLAQSEAALIAAQASYASAKTKYDQSLNDLRLYSIIRSPINGAVIDRAVEAGQTVAASLSTPTLFTLAEDLTQMEILAYVDESDIGMVQRGMPARFTVDAYPDQSYDGVVSQVRLQPVTLNNVVNYIVVVQATNEDGKLLPGMTATVDLITQQVSDVFVVPATVLAFRPDTASMQAVFAQKRAAFAARAGASQESISAGGAPPAPPAAASGETSSSGNSGMLWYLNNQGMLDMMRVRVGATDGSHTQVLGPGLAEGMQLIVKQTGEAQSSSSRQNGLFSMPGPPRGGRR